MGSVRRPLYSGSDSTQVTSFIQCVDGQEPQMHEFWCLVLDGIIREGYPTMQVEITAGTVGEFVTDYLAEDGCRIEIIGQLSVNDSIHFFGVLGQVGRIVLPFIFNLLDPVEATGWGSGKYSNQEWGGSLNKTNSMTNVA